MTFRVRSMSHLGSKWEPNTPVYLKRFFILIQRSHATVLKCFPCFLLCSTGVTFFLSALHSDLKRKAKSVKDYQAKIELLGSYDPQKQLIIKDPYYVSIQANS